MVAVEDCWGRVTEGSECWDRGSGHWEGPLELRSQKDAGPDEHTVGLTLRGAHAGRRGLEEAASGGGVGSPRGADGIVGGTAGRGPCPRGCQGEPSDSRGRRRREASTARVRLWLLSLTLEQQMVLGLGGRLGLVMHLPGLRREGSVGAAPGGSGVLVLGASRWVAH